MLALYTAEPSRCNLIRYLSRLFYIHVTIIHEKRYHERCCSFGSWERGQANCDVAPRFITPPGSITFFFCSQHIIYSLWVIAPGESHNSQWIFGLFKRAFTTTNCTLFHDFKLLNLDACGCAINFNYGVFSVYSIYSREKEYHFSAGEAVGYYILSYIVARWKSEARSRSGRKTTVHFSVKGT